MKIPMPEPHVARDGTVTLHDNIIGCVGEHNNRRGWWARVDNYYRKNGSLSNTSNTNIVLPNVSARCIATRTRRPNTVYVIKHSKCNRHNRRAGCINTFGST
jgi:hypothetical protein